MLWCHHPQELYWHKILMIIMVINMTLFLNSTISEQTCFVLIKVVSYWRKNNWKKWHKILVTMNISVIFPWLGFQYNYNWTYLKCFSFIFVFLNLNDASTIIILWFLALFMFLGSLTKVFCRKLLIRIQWSFQLYIMVFSKRCKLHVAKQYCNI